MFCPAASTGSKPSDQHAARRATPVAVKAPPTEKQLAQLARGLKQKNPSAVYAKLSALATQKNSGVLGMRAALALGYFDYSKGHYPEAAKWLARALGDPLLRDYSLYWSAQTNLAIGLRAEALVQLKLLRKNFPDTVLTEQALQSLGEYSRSVTLPSP